MFTYYVSNRLTDGNVTHFNWATNNSDSFESSNYKYLKNKIIKEKEQNVDCNNLFENSKK